MTLSMVEAAFQILSKNGKPMYYRDIVREAIASGLIDSVGRTPGASLTSAIYRENKRREGRGEPLRFDPRGEGMYGLVEWRPTGLHQQIQEINRETRMELHERIQNMKAKEFENLVAQILDKIGFDRVEVRGRSGDKGIDVVGEMNIANLADIRVGIQVKKTSSKITPGQIRELRGSLKPDQIGIFFAASDFTKQAKAEAETEEKNPIKLVNGDEVIDLMIEHEIGIRRHTAFEINEESWAEYFLT